MRFKRTLTIAALLGGFLMPAWSQDIHHHHGKSPDVDRFYSTWMRPDQPQISCCSHTDCDEAEVRNVSGEWFAKRVSKGEKFVRVPQSKIEQRRDSPDGRNHLCKSNYSDDTYCLVLGSGT